ncbi:MAG TPA: hypothetical protein HPP77_08780 [Candidatus Hydrogenedentes bacterium]|nr:hypothetical protein [Candidatus Hydrogenedentota bacterium]HIJ73829.1 hypothetical protein [Candidatus Hydrogenedentota bacterium]
MEAVSSDKGLLFLSAATRRRVTGGCRALRNLTLFVVVIALANVAFERAFPRRSHCLLDSKLNHLQQQIDRYDVVFIGSSLVYRGVDPAVFNEELSKRGWQLDSFNFGVPGIQFEEMGLLIERMVAMNPERLKWLVIDLHSLSYLLGSTGWYTKRHVAWHTPSATLNACVRLWGGRKRFATKLNLTRVHLGHLVMKCLNIGRGGQLLDGSPETPTERNRGYESLEMSYRTAVESGGDSAEKQLAERARVLDVYRKFYSEDVSALKTRIQDDSETDGALPGAFDRLLLARQNKRIREAGMMPLYFVMPADPTVFPIGLPARALHRAGDIVLIGDYHDPLNLPELFAPKNRYDRNHMSETGARLLSELLAADFVRTAERHR